jgi:hypothetical protein
LWAIQLACTTGVSIGSTDGVNSGISLPLFYVFDSSSPPCRRRDSCSRLLVLLQDAITSNHLAVRILMVTIHLVSLSLSLDVAKGSFVVQLWIPEHMGHLYGFYLLSQNLVFWKDQSSLMLSR